MNIPTAEEFYRLSPEWGNAGKEVHRKMIEFAKLHVKEALKRAYRNQGMSWTNSKDEEVKLDLFMRNSYPLDNIK